MLKTNEDIALQSRGILQLCLPPYKLERLQDFSTLSGAIGPFSRSVDG